VVIEVESHIDFENVYWIKLDDVKRVATRNLSPGRAVYGEDLVKFKSEEYRSWNPFRSKLSAVILKGLRNLPLKRACKILYLGAATGTTASHVSDIIDDAGSIFCVEFAPRVFRELIDRVCKYRTNMIPIFENARFPERYRMLLEEVDTIYCDVAQSEQAKILADNADMFLKSRGWILLAIKARSIDATEEPSKIYEMELGVLRNRGFEVKQVLDLEPYDKDHVMVLAQYPK
jgi:fibrillarin-like pre-rRNA processing protein